MSGADMHADKLQDTLRAEFDQAKAHANTDAERAARKRMAALGITQAAKAREVAAKQSSDEEPAAQARPPQDRRAPKRATTAKRTGQRAS